MKYIHRNFQVIIIGAGGAGLMAALSCIKNGIKDVAVISKVFPTQSHTVAAKGGINAALGNVENDNWQWHCYDTIRGADYLADYDAVELMCREAPQAIIDLEKMGVVFSRDENGKIYQRIYGGQKTNFGQGQLAHRSCSAKDATGHTILNTLYQQCLKNNVKFFSEFFVTDLLITKDKASDGTGSPCLEGFERQKNDKVVFSEKGLERSETLGNQQTMGVSKSHGVMAIDLNNGQINIFQSLITILATGGYSQIYQNTTAADICTGDGNAMILKAGLPLQDMEFVQFHPTSLYGTGLLMTEAARGEGGYLLNSLGEKFMTKYAPNYGDLASRDVVSRAMATEIYEGRGCGANKDHLHLVISHLPEKTIKEKLPSIVEIAQAFANLDVFRDPIPIAPAAHYTMGGIPTNLNGQVLNNHVAIDGLMAIGEAASASVHGANRLGCNSLLDIIVFGNLSGKVAAETLQKLKKHADVEANIEKIVEQKLQRLQQVLNQSGDQSIFTIKTQLKNTVEKFIGVFRNQTLLETGLEKLLVLKEQLKLVEIKNKNLLWNSELTEFFQTENLLLQAIVTAYSALKRLESRGAHFRQDFINRDDENWLCHSLVSFDSFEGSFDFKTKPVRIKPIGDEQIIITPETRKY